MFFLDIPMFFPLLFGRFGVNFGAIFTNFAVDLLVAGVAGVAVLLCVVVLWC